MLNEFAITDKSTSNLLDVGGEGLSSESESQYLCDVAHALLLFVEKLVEKLRTAKTCFEKNPGGKGAAQALRDWEKFHTSDDTEFEVTFDGPTGRGHNGKCVGCQPFFEKLGLKSSDFEILSSYFEAFSNHFRGNDGSEASTERDKLSTLVDRLGELVIKLKFASETPE